MIRQHSQRLHLVAFALALGCAEFERAPRADSGDDESSSESGEAAVEIDEDEIMSLALDFETELQRFTTEPELSETHSDAASVHVWGSPEAAERFLSIDPMNPTQEVNFEEGIMLVKEHFDEMDERVGITVMYKGPPGYNDSARDWFWARVFGTEVTHSGHVDFCADCHAAAHNSDYVVGFAKSE